MTQRAGAVAALMRCTPQGASRSLCAVEHAEQAGPPLDPLHNRPTAHMRCKAARPWLACCLQAHLKPGITPLELMLKRMRYYHSLAEEKCERAKRPTGAS
jgi:hypothetical protein